MASPISCVVCAAAEKSGVGETPLEARRSWTVDRRTGASRDVPFLSSRG